MDSPVQSHLDELNCRQISIVVVFTPAFNSAGSIVFVESVSNCGHPIPPRRLCPFWKPSSVYERTSLSIKHPPPITRVDFASLVPDLFSNKVSITFVEIQCQQILSSRLPITSEGLLEHMVTTWLRLWLSAKTLEPNSSSTILLFL